MLGKGKGRNCMAVWKKKGKKEILAMHHPFPLPPPPFLFSSFPCPHKEKEGREREKEKASGESNDYFFFISFLTVCLPSLLPFPSAAVGLRKG